MAIRNNDCRVFGSKIKNPVMSKKKILINANTMVLHYHFSRGGDIW